MSTKKDVGYRPRLTEEESEMINSHRALRVECETNGIPMSDVNHYWHKGKSFSLHVKNSGVNLDKVREDMIKAMNNHSPSYPKIKRNRSEDGHLLVIDPADIHIGKLATSFETGEDYNSQIAVKRVKKGVKGILQKSNGFNIDKILFVGGNDILHIDEPHRKTTAGTPQDTDGMWYDNFMTAKKLYIDVLETLMSVADVHFVYNPSNHDYISGFMLSDSIQSWFRKSKNITFDCSIAHRKGFKYGQNLIGTTHGDGAKLADLPLIMANEFSREWADTKHRYVYTHHIHHKSSKDYHGITVESLRSPSGSDSWHHRKGYGVGGVKAVEGFIHSKDHGQVARLTHIF
jgi:hypothetical protein|tara:strand:+ start:1460 stop:2494 length:1035 start_codon:yes stop_codon:yes gene_type:complete